jgi:hypothetical protein
MPKRLFYLVPIILTLAISSLFLLKRQNIFLHNTKEHNSLMSSSSSLKTKYYPLKEQSKDNAQLTNNIFLQINDANTKKENNETLETLLTNEALLSAANVGKEGQGFLRKKANFYNRTSQLQRQKGKEVISLLKKAMSFPLNANFHASFKKIGDAKVSYIVDSYFKAPMLYREDAQGQNSYNYVSDGIYELTNYAQNIVTKQEGIVLKDMDSQIFLESFPIRIFQDNDLVWMEEKSTYTDLHKLKEIKVNTLSNWFYDIDVREDNNLVHEVRFYSRNNRTKEIARISNIAYKDYDIENLKGNSKLPYSYTISFKDASQNQSYGVKIDYLSFEEQPSKIFNLEIKK